jgi:hypothetical protein
MIPEKYNDNNICKYVATDKSPVQNNKQIVKILCGLLVTGVKRVGLEMNPKWCECMSVE